MLTTPNYSWPYPESTDTPDVPRDVRSLALAADASLLSTNNNVASNTLAVAQLTGRFAKYTAAITATGANQPLATNATTAIQLINPRKTSALVTASGTNNTTFTLGASGNWSFSAAIRVSPGTTGAHFVQLIRNDTSEIIAAWFPGSIATGSTYDATMSGDDYFATAGISVSLIVITGSGIAGSVIGSGAVGTGLRTSLSMQWEGN